MRSLVAIGLAMLAAAQAPAVHADPATPQLSPLHGRREDTERLREQLRALDRGAPPEPTGPALDPATLDADPAGSASTTAHDRSLVRRWWFWAALGAVAATAIGVTYEATRGTSPHLPGVTCNASGCLP
jgi:hypothetical protein